MARFLVTSGSKFNPLSYDEIVKPLQQMTEAQNAAAESYGELDMQTSALEKYISKNPGDRQARQLYDSYKQQLTSLQDNLWNNGFNAQTVRELNAARSGYTNNILRLQKAIQNRQERSKEYWDTWHKNPDMIMGADPGISGLDNYLDNDNYGQDWYSYSGKQFMTEVGTDAQARAAEMLRVTDPVRNPKLAGYLERIVQSGYTSAEVARATEAVRAYYGGDENALAGLDEPSSILAGVLVSHMESTGARDNVDATQFDRLLRYGEQGLAHAIGKKDIDTKNDLAWKYAMDEAAAERDYQRKLNYELAKAQIAAGAADRGKLDETITENYTGEHYQETRSKLDKQLGKGKTYGLIITKDGKEVRTPVEAASIVYSDDVGRRSFAVLGFDARRDPTPVKVGNTPEEKMLHGEITRDGVKYETMFNPYAKNYEGGAVLVRRKGSKENWRAAPELTRQYQQFRNSYESTLNYYKNSQKDVYDRARSLDPDKQADMYEEMGVSFGTPITSYEQAVLNQPQNMKSYYNTGLVVAQDATDEGKYINKFSSILSLNLGKHDKKALGFLWKTGEEVGPSKRQLRAYERTNPDASWRYIHPIVNGIVQNEAIGSIDDVFTFDENQNIKNIKRIILDEDGVRGGYFRITVVNPDGAVGEYAVSADMFSGDKLESIIVGAHEKIKDLNPNSPNYRKNVNTVLQIASKELKNILGNEQVTQSQGGTYKEGND